MTLRLAGWSRLNKEVDFPRILVNYDQSPDADKPYYNKEWLIENNAARYYMANKIIVLSHGDFVKRQIRQYKRTLEQDVAATLSHEFIHHLLNVEQNWKVCKRFDRIAKKLADYGAW